MSDPKAEVVAALVPIFGDTIKEFIDIYYDEKNPSQLFDMTKKLLARYAGETYADEIMAKIRK